MARFRAQKPNSFSNSHLQGLICRFDKFIAKTWKLSYCLALPRKQVAPYGRLRGWLMNASRTFSVFVFLACWFIRGDLSAQELKCDSVRPVLGSSSAYKNRGNRCEGLYVADVGSRSIDIVSFTSGSIRYDLNAKSPLKLSVVGRSPLVNVRAVAITPKTYYRMDTFLQPGKTLIWPVTDVLLPEHLTDNRIGIFGWTGTEEGKTFVPVDVKSGAAPPASDHVMLVAQTSFDADAIKWRWARTQGKACQTFGGWEDAISHQTTANSPIKVDFKRLPVGVDCVELVARSHVSNDWVTLKFRVEMPQ